MSESLLTSALLLNILGTFENQLRNSYDQYAGLISSNVIRPPPPEPKIASCPVCIEDKVCLECEECGYTVCPDCVLTSFEKTFTGSEFPVCLECKKEIRMLSKFEYSKIKKAISDRVIELDLGAVTDLSRKTHLPSELIRRKTALINVISYYSSRLDVDIFARKISKNNNGSFTSPFVPLVESTVNYEVIYDIITKGADDIVNNHPKPYTDDPVFKSLISIFKTPKNLSNAINELIFKTYNIQGYYSAKGLKAAIGEVSENIDAKPIDILGYKLTYSLFDDINIQRDLILRSLDNIITETKRHIQMGCFNVGSDGVVCNNGKMYVMSIEEVVDGFSGIVGGCYKCCLCDTVVCISCLCKVNKDVEHACDKDAKESITLIKNETRPCPDCGVKISKIDGCTHMFCVECKTCFDWATGEIQAGNTNPLFHEWKSEMPTEHTGDLIISLGGDGMTSLSRYRELRNYFEELRFSKFSDLLNSAYINEKNFVHPLIKYTKELNGNKILISIVHHNGLITDDSANKMFNFIFATQRIVEMVIYIVSKFNKTLTDNVKKAYTSMSPDLTEFEKMGESSRLGKNVAREITPLAENANSDYRTFISIMGGFDVPLDGDTEATAADPADPADIGVIVNNEFSNMKRIFPTQIEIENWRDLYDPINDRFRSASGIFLESHYSTIPISSQDVISASINTAETVSKISSEDISFLLYP